MFDEAPLCRQELLEKDPPNFSRLSSSPQRYVLLFYSEVSSDNDKLMNTIGLQTIGSGPTIKMLIKTKPLYSTIKGQAYHGDAINLLGELPSNSVDLAITSPPFALQRKKEYGNKDQNEYIDWLLSFTLEVRRVLKDSGSFVIDMGGAYQKNRPIRSLYNFRTLIRLCDEQDWRLAEEFYWFNPSKLPSPIEWVNKRKIRAKDSVNTVWWLAKTDFPKADISNVLAPYSDRMKKLLSDSEKYYKPKERPSGHKISTSFGRDNGGAIPSNLLSIANSESNSAYLRYCKELKVKSHPARFPSGLPEFFINFLTDRNDLVLDFFAGSNTTGAAAEGLDRNWIAFEERKDYLAGSVFRFLQKEKLETNLAKEIHRDLSGNTSMDIKAFQLKQLRLLEDKPGYRTS
jgi:site-specific DNA-methyltransferase (cytosine-N4-specific)